MAGLNIIDYLKRAAVKHPDKDAFVFLKNKGSTKISFEDLYIEVASVAKRIEKETTPNCTIAILSDIEQEFVLFFLACLMAGRIAVPLYEAKNEKKSSILSSIFFDCNTSHVIVTGGNIKKISVEKKLEVDLDCAYLQYTSGSTSAPKGVVIDHSSILSNCSKLKSSAECSASPNISPNPYIG